MKLINFDQDVDPLRVDSFLAGHPPPPPTYQETPGMQHSTTIDANDSSLTREPPAYTIATANASPKVFIKSESKRSSTSSKVNKKRDRQRKKCMSEPIIYKPSKNDKNGGNDDTDLNNKHI
jgi:hypothetical protein